MCTGPNLYMTTDSFHTGAVDLLPHSHGFEASDLASRHNVLTHQSTVEIHEWEHSAHCREQDTGGRCGATGDVGVKTSGLSTHVTTITSCTIIGI